ncbi:MAG: hypothetical protein WD898_00760, partial [Candidatus Paceibacterota bacterium]
MPPVDPPTTGNIFRNRVGIINTDGIGFVEVRHLSDVSISARAISDDGSKVIVSTDRNPSDVFTANTDGTNVTFLLSASFIQFTPMQFTADSSRFVYTSNGNIFIEDINNPSSSQQITPDGSATDASISGSGTKILFLSTADITGQNPDGNFEVFLANV